MPFLRTLHKRRLRHRSGSAVTLSDADRETLALVDQDPRFFSKFWFQFDLLDHQYEIAQALQHGSVAVRSGNGVGKTATAANIAIHWLCTRQGSMVLTTAPTFRQVKEILWPEIHRLYGESVRQTIRLPSGLQIGGGLGPAPNTTSWELAPGWTMLGVSPRRKENFQGHHPRGGMLVIADEASGISDDIYHGMLSVTTGRHDRIFAIGNPTMPGGWFHRIFNDPRFGERWTKIHLDSERMPWIANASSDPPFPGLVSREWIHERLAECGGDREDPMYQVHVRGNFPDTSDEFLLTLYQAESACDEPEPDKPVYTGKPHVLAVDIARGGRNRSVLCWIRGNLVTRMLSIRIPDLTYLADRIISEWSKDRTDAVIIDADGLGVGVFDILRRERKFPVFEFHGNAEAWDPRKYFNARAEGYGILADDFIDSRIRIDAKNIPREISQRLCIQLAYIRKKWAPRDGRLMIESKDDMAKAGKASPDEADALMMARWGQRKWVRIRRNKIKIVAG